MKAALFDADDTLLHHWLHKRDRFPWLCEQAGLHVPNAASIRLRASRAVERFFQHRQEHAAGKSAAWWIEYFRIGLAELRLPVDQAPAVARTALGLPKTRWLDPATLPLLSALRAKGYRIGLVSNWDGTLAETCAELVLTPFVDHIGDSRLIGVEKPDPGIFHHVLKQLNVAPADAFHVGDSYGADVVGARAAGVTPVLLDVLECEERPCEHRITRLEEILPLCERL